MSYLFALLEKKSGATKTTTAINLLGALLETGATAIVCDMDKEKQDSIYLAENKEELSKYVISLFEVADFRKKYQF